MPGIFLSYRRQDSSGWAGNLSRGLAEEFGKDKVFFDLATLEPGVDYAEAIERRVGLADVLIVVIGPHWLTAADENRQRRLDDPEDLVRMEVAEALKRNIPVVPVLVGGAAMPSASELPEELRGLARRNAYELSDRRWNYDLGQLISYLRKVFSQKRFRFTRTLTIAFASSLLVLIIVAAVYYIDGIEWDSDLSMPGDPSSTIEEREQQVVPPTVYFQFAILPRDQAQRIAASLAAKGYDVPDVDREETATQVREVRYFYDGDRKPAEDLARHTEAVLAEFGWNGVSIDVKDLTAYRGPKPHPGVLELWLGLQPLSQP